MDYFFRWMETSNRPFYMAMDQYLLIPFLGGWTSINPSYFDVNYRGTRFWHTAISFYRDIIGCRRHFLTVLDATSTIALVARMGSMNFMATRENDPYGPYAWAKKMEPILCYPKNCQKARKKKKTRSVDSTFFGQCEANLWQTSFHSVK